MSSAAHEQSSLSIVLCSARAYKLGHDRVIPCEMSRDLAAGGCKVEPHPLVRGLTRYVGVVQRNG